MMNHQTSSSQSKPKAKRRVQFQKIPQVRIWESYATTTTTATTTTNSIGMIQNKESKEIHNDETQKNSKLLWYSVDELDQMRHEVKMQSKKFRTSLNAYISSTTNSYCIPTTTSSSNSTSNNSSTRNSTEEVATTSNTTTRPLDSSLFFPFENSNVEKKMQILRYELPLHCSSSTTSRGLEPRIFIEKQINRATVIKSVFQFQHRVQALITFAQSNGRSEDAIKRMKEKYSERLGIMCAEISSWARHEALTSAGYDAKCANQILKCTHSSMSDCCGSSSDFDSSSEEEEDKGMKNNDCHVGVENVLKRQRMDVLVGKIGLDKNMDDLSSLNGKRLRTTSPILTATTDVDEASSSS